MFSTYSRKVTDVKTKQEEKEFDVEKRFNRITKKQWIRLYMELFRDTYGHFRRDYEIISDAEDRIERWEEKE